LERTIRKYPEHEEKPEDMPRKTYRIVDVHGNSAHLTVPRELARVLVPLYRRYTCELTSEGLLYRPATDEPESIDLPDWAKES
jgi:hypothetical protein